MLVLLIRILQPLMINVILEEPDGRNKVFKDVFGQSHVVTFALNVADMNNQKFKNHLLKDDRANANTASYVHKRIK